MLFLTRHYALSMEHEISGHTKKIYRALKNKKLRIGEKVKDLVVEILIIVFAVSLSIWFHSWAEHRHQQREVREFLKGLSDNLSDDIKQVTTNRNIIEHLYSNYKKILLPGKGHESEIDSLIAHFEVELIVTRPNIGRYEGFKSSGKIGTIENDNLKESILVFYEQTIPELVYGENFVNNLQMKIQERSFQSIGKMTQREFAATPEIQSLLWLCANNFNVNNREYEKVADHAKKIIEQIRNESD